MGRIGFSELLLLLGIVVLLFGTKKLSNLGTDLGSAIRGFRKAMEHPEGEPTPSSESSKQLSHLPSSPDEQIKTSDTSNNQNLKT
ncbi:Sec-independent protein translocase protein TatA [Gammaproteobacteria bacterium]